MRWHSSVDESDDHSLESPTNSRHDNDIPAMSSSMEEDEPDSSSQEHVHADGTTNDRPRHGRLGTSESELSLSADRVLEKENLSSLEEEKKQSELDKGQSDPPGRYEESSKKTALTPVSAEEDSDAEEEDDDGLDHSQPPDDSSETDTQAIPWKPQTTQSTCEFTHTIVNYSQKRESGCKKAEYSATTVDEFGNRWRLIVYVNGNGRASNHHLSLFLQVADADDLPFGWKKAVSYVLTLEHPGGSNLSYAKRNPDKTFKLCPKAIDWGWSQFITSDRIQQEGFVSNDSLTVRASVTVKSSSVSIDPEDAELYLKCAVEEGGAEAVELCLAQGASVNCKFKDDLYTPLHTACSSGTNGGSMEVLNLLLERGADGNACNKWRETPLLIAANNGHRAAVEALLKNGADPSLCSEAGWSALTFAAHKGYDDIVGLLLKAGAPVNCRVTEDSSTPLHKACAGSKPGHLSAVKQLLEGDADVHALNKWRETPLLTAANHGQAGAVDALLKAGADPCKCTDTGWSPLSIAAYKGHDAVVRLLLEEGAPTEEADPTLSALLQAATKGLPDTVELLLRHGADHTVTTKKGDTALSILVEQNLIDAAVEMVSEYKASVPRCSRDRKKVQRARLLINLRMKQQQREGKHLTVGSDDEDETDDESENAKNAQHNEDGEDPITVSTEHNNEKKKKKKSKLSAEEQARQAEEALLLELEQEDAKAKKEEAEANSKRAKKKKKKERERQQKLREEEEQREKEEKEAKERERIRKEKEEEERKELQQKLMEQREREMREAAERERIAAAKRREKEEKEKEKKQRELEQKQKERQEKKATTSGSPSGTVASDRRSKAPKATVGQNSKSAGRTPASNRNGMAEALSVKKSAIEAPAKVAVPSSGQPIQGKNRGWETKGQPVGKQPDSSKRTGRNLAAQDVGATSRGNGPEGRTPILPPPAHANNSIPSTFLAPRPSEYSTASQGATSFTAFDKPMSSGRGQMPYLSSMGTKNQSPPAVNQDAFSNALDSGLPLNFNAGSAEHPAVGLFRHEKVTELFHRCRLAFGVIDELALRRILYRWVIRASHNQSAYLDCIIPSWVDFDQLVAFFQRQCITESRKGGNSGSDMVNMESLRDAGSSIANLCHNQAKEVVRFRLRMEQQLPRDWSDASLGMSAADARNGGSIGVVVDWANRQKVYFSSEEFTSLRTRYVGPPNRFLTNIFVTKTRYETKRMISGDSNLDYRIPPSTKRCLSSDAAVTAELYSDPMSALASNVFWGNFEDLDAPFGGLAPFAKDEGNSEELLSRHGGSVAVLLPFDSMVATKYMHRMLDILQECDAQGTAVLFVTFIHAECFHDLNASPSRHDLFRLDPRLGGNYAYLRQVEHLAPGQHFYFSGEGGGVSKVSNKGTLLVLLQNESARASFVINESCMSKIKQSMSSGVQATTSLAMVNPVGFNGDFVPRESPSTPHSGYFDALPPVSPTAQHYQQTQPAMMDFPHMSGSDIEKAFSPSETRRAPARRGRLFELVDDGEEEQLNDVDVVSGMLNNLNVDLFQNNVPQDVDIEAISLMGIGGPPSRSLPPGNPHSHGRYG